MPDAPAPAMPALTERLGLDSGVRYRCDGCGNLTRFDVSTTEHVRRFWHFDLAGNGTVEDEAVREVDISEVTCRWCGTGARVEVVPTPGSSAG